MSKTHRLARRPDPPSLTRVVTNLTPAMLHQLVRSRGLDACGELVALATPAQLNSVLDLDLWSRAQPGRDDQFDVERFGEWLEVLVDTGDTVAARIVAALDKGLVIAGLSRYLRVFDPGTFEPTASSDDEPMERHDRMNSETSANVLECDVGGYLVRARRTDAWDAIVTLLVTLETEHVHDFHALMQGCRRLSNSRPEIDGLDDLLMAPEQHLHDVAGDRERRRAGQGYATPADSRAFLRLARQPRAASAPAAPIALNPIAAAYFRALEEDAVVTPDASIEAAVELLAEVGARPERPRLLLESANDDPRVARIPLLSRLMVFVSNHDEPAHLTRTRELAFLANTLLAGCTVQSRPFTPEEASEAAACVCNLGLDCWPGTPGPADAFLRDHDLVTAFEAGWSRLHQDVSLFAADQLVSALADLRVADAETRRGLRVFGRTLAKQREAGTPWLARGAADVLAMFDMTAWIGVLGLLDECPILSEALTAVLERRTTPVSPTAFEFISTTAQIGDVRLFMRALPAVLSS